MRLYLAITLRQTAQQIQSKPYPKCASDVQNLAHSADLNVLLYVQILHFQDALQCVLEMHGLMRIWVIGTMSSV